jgi:hypothetical protein
MLSSGMGELVARFLIGGTMVSVSAAIAEMVRPKSFAGLFGAAPFALATLGITIAQLGRTYAAFRNPVDGAGRHRLLCYAAAASPLLIRHKRALPTSIALLPV